MKRPDKQAPYVPAESYGTAKTNREGKELAELVRKGLISRAVVMKRTDRVAVAALADLKERP